ncbi:polysaccharide biosynthesis C-terminal domain-containing protein, partial [Peribacillus sp. NPDC056705]|uniref:oligosaccharide flippase family protein n=1 Tax=Peribacillus sp. NPDC056705 TaxID=3345918 RepID=UPI00374821B9
FIIAFSLYSAVLRFYTDYKDDRDKLKRFYGTIIVFIFISGTLFVSLGIILHKVLISLFFKDISFYPIVLISLLTLIFISVHMIHQNILQSMQQGKKLTKINLLIFGLQICLNLFFIGILKMGAMGIILATLIINVGYFIYMLNDLKKNNLITFCLDKEILSEALKYSIPLMPHNLSTVIASFVSRIFINTSGSLASVGLYSIALQFSVLIDGFQVAVNNAFTPWFFDMMNKNSKESKKDIVSYSKFLLILYSFLYLGIGLFSPELILFLTNERYSMAWTVIPILVIAYSVKSIYYFFVNILLYFKDAARKIFIATFIGSFFDIILAYILVPKFGMYGAACAFLIAKVIVVTIIVFISKKYNNIGYRVSEMVKIIIPSLLFIGIGLYLSYTEYLNIFSWFNLSYKLGILLVYMVYIYLTNKKMINNIIESREFRRILRRKVI